MFDEFLFTFIGFASGIIVVIAILAIIKILD